MSLKLVIFMCLVATAFAGFLPIYGPPQHTIIKQVQVQAAPEAPANYEFKYDVNEASTGDVHSQQESAKNGAVWGSYQLNDADGFRRIVDYTADDVNGFQANVRREPLGHQTTIIKKIIAVAPAHAPWAAPARAPWSY